MDEIENDARRLPPGELEQLIDRLQAALDEAPRTEIEGAWGREVERRQQEMRDGRVRGIPASEVFADLEQMARPSQSLAGLLHGRLHPQDPAVSEEDAVSALLLEEDSRSREPGSG